MNDLRLLEPHKANLEPPNDITPLNDSISRASAASLTHQVALQSFEARATPTSCQSCTDFWSSRPVQILSVFFVIAAIIACVVSPGGLASILLLSALAVALFVVIAAIQKDRIENAPFEDTVEEVPYAEENKLALTSPENLLNDMKLSRTPELITNFYHLTVQNKIKEALRTHLKEDLDNIFDADKTIGAEVVIDNILDTPKASLLNYNFSFRSIKKIILHFYKKNDRVNCEKHILSYLLAQLDQIILPVINDFIAANEKQEISNSEVNNKIANSIQTAIDNLSEINPDWSPAEILLSPDFNHESAAITKNALCAGIQDARQKLREFLEDYESPLSGNDIPYSAPLTEEQQTELQQFFDELPDDLNL